MGKYVLGVLDNFLQVTKKKYLCNTPISLLCMGCLPKKKSK